MSASSGDRFHIAKRSLRNACVDFILGFSASAFVPDHAAAACVKFLRECFLFYSREIKTLPERHSSRASLARIRAFAADDACNAHTGAVLMESVKGEVQTTEFRMGLPSVAPFGMDFPKCSSCGTASLTSSKQKNSVKVTCRNLIANFTSPDDTSADAGVGQGQVYPCPFQKTLKRPDFVTELDISEIGQHHYILEFPHPLEIDIGVGTKMV